MFGHRTVLAVVTVLVAALALGVSWAGADPPPLNRPAVDTVVISGDDKVIVGVEEPDAVVVRGDSKADLPQGTTTPTVVIQGDSKADLPQGTATDAEPTSALDWRDVGIGVGIGVAAALLLGGVGVYVVRHPPGRHPPTGRPPTVAAH
jgi:hypothetical protein